MLSHFYVKYQCQLKLIAHIDVPQHAVHWWLEITQMFGATVMKQNVRFIRIKGTYPEDEAIFLFDADVELKGHI
jgi:hypothetical protein